LANPGTVVLRLGGKYLDSAVISGMVGTVKDDRTARELLKAFSDEIQRRFTAIKGCWVGPSALSLLRAGSRLTNSATAHFEYDLVE
jgi:hypothetical protein